ncbi:MAG: 2-amino-4-hydroxy-6-hydroxymethyldihydropteridine diphosphokinase [Thermogutta sp.]
MATVLIGLGSNLGERQTVLSHALDAISCRAAISVEKVSRYREYPAAGGDTPQLPFLNAAAVLHTRLSPIELLRVLHKTEERLGRKRSERWGPRTIDLDILLYDDLVLVSADITIPHPRFAGRFFALEPATEIAPARHHPVCNMTLAAMLTHLRQAPPWIALAPAGFGEWDAASPFSRPKSGDPKRESRKNSPAPGENAAAGIAAESVALLRARSRKKIMPAVADHRSADGDAGASSSLDVGPAVDTWVPEFAARYHDMPDRGSHSVLITADWESVAAGLSSSPHRPTSPAAGSPPRLVIFGPAALQYLPSMACGRFSERSQARPDCEASSILPASGFNAEGITENLRSQIETCRGKVPMVFVESKEPRSIIFEIAGIVEGAIQPACE